MGRAELGGLLAGRYRLRAVVRRGAVGVIWRAEDEALRREVAVKELSWLPQLGSRGEESEGERALREARAVAGLAHRNIVGVYDVVDHDGRPWMVMQLAPFRFPWRPLSDVVRDEGPLQPVQAARIGLQVLSAIDAAHAAGVVHRAIQPGNVLIGPSDRVMLAGLGMTAADAATAAPEAVIGSANYLAPERVRGDPASTASDLWSVGATLYAAVEGRLPFDRDGTAAVLNAVVGDDLEPPRRLGPLWPLVSALLRKDSRARPDADQAQWLLQRVAARHGGPAAAAPAQPAAPMAGAGPGFIPGFGPGDDQPARHVPLGHPTPAKPPRGGDRPRQRLLAAAAIIILGTGTILAAINLAPASTPGRRVAVPGQPAASPGYPGAPPRRHRLSPAPQALRGRPVWRPGPAAPALSRLGAPAPGTSGSGLLPAGFSWYQDPTGFSIGTPDHWKISHQGHLVYIQDPSSGRFLIIDQTTDPKPSPLADWRQQEAARISTYPGYHRIRLQPVRYPQAEQAADWEFTYYHNGQLTHVLNRNVLANAQHAYALYWSTPASAWNASYHYFQIFAATFRPAGGTSHRS